MYEVDARGYSCPEPVLMAQEALKKHGGSPLKIQVSSTNARDNVKALAQKLNKKTTITQSGPDFQIIIE